MTQLAQLYLTADELGTVVELLDAKLEPMPMEDEEWGHLNSLRTAFTEAKWSAERTSAGTHDT